MDGRELKRRARKATREFERERKATRTAERESEIALRHQRAVDAFGGVPLSAAPLPVAKRDVLHVDVVGQASIVYVAWPVDDSYVKIGSTQKLVDRLSNLQTGNPRRLALLVAFYAGERGWTEERLQARFAAQRQGGEWFRIEGEVRTWLEPTLEQARVERGPAQAWAFGARATRGG